MNWWSVGNWANRYPDLGRLPPGCCTWFIRSTIIFCITTYSTIGTIIVEYKDRSTRFGWNYITTLMQAQGRRMEAVFPDDTSDELVNDCVSIITSMAVRIYGRRGSRRKAQRIKQCEEQVMKAEDEP